MRPRTRAAALTLLATLALAVPHLQADDDTELTGDLKTLQGTWTSRDDSGESTWSFVGKKLTLKTPTREYKISITVFPDAKPQKGIDFLGDPDSPNAKGYLAPGIYKFDGETKLSIAFGGEDSGRPDKFMSDFQQGVFAFELTKK